MLLLLDYLPRRFLTIFSLSNNGKIFCNKITGILFPILPSNNSVKVLRNLRETIKDNIFLLYKTDQGHRSIAYIYCYYSRFNLLEKLNKLLFNIYKPVPSYNKIGLSIERYFKKLEVGKNIKYVNVSNCPTS